MARGISFSRVVFVFLDPQSGFLHIKIFSRCLFFLAVSPLREGNSQSEAGLGHLGSTRAHGCEQAAMEPQVPFSTSEPFSLPYSLTGGD